MLVKVSDLRDREIINVLDGRRLGPIKDIDIDLELGRIKAIILPGPGKILGFFGRGDDFVIPWEKIIRIGVDVILVDAPPFQDNKSTYKEQLSREEYYVNKRYDE